MMCAALLVGCNGDKPKSGSLSTMPDKVTVKDDAADGAAESADADKKEEGEAKMDGDYRTSAGTQLTGDNAVFSYMVGVNIGTNVRGDMPDIDLTMVMEGMNDALNESVVISQEDQQKIMQNLQQTMMENRRKVAEQQAVVNEAEAKAFLEKNKVEEGVKVTASGLQYKVLTAGGKTEKPQGTDKVTVHYAGRLLDGTEFDKIGRAHV